MPITLGEHAYGKSKIHLVKVSRGPDRHDLRDVVVDVRFEGRYRDAHLSGDNTAVLPTDTMKNTVYGLAREHLTDEIERFGLALVDHFLAGNPELVRVTVRLLERPWTRIAVSGMAHPHAFSAGGPDRRVATVTGGVAGATVESGVEDLELLKTTGSGFAGFRRDRFTTLREARDRILATALSASWFYVGRQIDYGNCWRGVKRLLQETFANHDSRSVQHTLFALGEAVLRGYQEIDRIRLTAPNLHHLPVDLQPFGVENPNEIFVATSEPHGLIEATVERT
jgi:urate oxidase